MKKLDLYDYHFIDKEVKLLEMIQESLSSDLSSYVDIMEDKGWVDDLQSAKEIFASFAVAVKRNAKQISRSIDALKEANTRNLNTTNNRGKDNQIKPEFDYEFMRQYAVYD